MEKLELTKKYAKYPEYKDSGVEWFGGIPKNWDVAPLRSVLIERKEKNTKLVTDNILSVMKDVGVIRYADKGDVGNKSSDRPENYKIVHAGDIVLNSMNLVIGSVGRSKEFGVTSSVYIIYYPRNNKISGEYYHYLFRDKSWQKTLGRLGKGIMELRESIKANDLKIESVPIPQLEEQTRITNYLDEKTAFIDQIIEKKQRQIELLRERRTAVINHAVTKGLDPKAELVDSGIDWIGKIPKGWETRMVKHVAEVLPSNVDKLTVEGETAVRLCNYTDVYKNDQITSPMIEDLMIASATQKQIQKLTLRKGDVIITKDSETPDDIGIPAYVPEDLAGVVCGYHLAIIRPQKVNGGYLAKFFLTHSAKTQFFLSANGLTRYAIGIGDIGGAFLPVPPREAQEQIAEYLDEKMKSFDMAVGHVEQSITLLQEFKSSLISHVVTGKVKVGETK